LCFRQAAEEFTQLWAEIDLVNVEDLILSESCSIFYEWTHRSYFDVSPTVAFRFTLERVQDTIEIFRVID